MAGPITNLTQTPAKTPGTTGSSTLARVGADGLGKQDFLKLLIAQLRNQDPMKPMEDREFIAQMAQFSALEAMQNIDQQMQALTTSQQFTQAASLVGKHVSAQLKGGEKLDGIVSEARISEDGPQLVVNGQTVALSQITGVRREETPTTTTTAPAPSTGQPAGAPGNSSAPPATAPAPVAIPARAPTDPRPAAAPVGPAARSTPVTPQAPGAAPLPPAAPAAPAIGSRGAPPQSMPPSNAGPAPRRP